MGKQKNKARRILKVISICAFILIFSVYILIPISFGWYSTLKHSEDVGEPPKDFSETVLKTSDGISLTAWYLSPKNGAVIILLHGATDSREGIRIYAQMLQKHGYGVLAFDMSGHGESGGDGVNAYGWNGTKDVGAAIDFLLKEKDVNVTGGLGISLGAEVLLGACSSYKDLRAVVSDGATYKTLQDYLMLPSRQGLLRSFTTRILFGSAQLISGTKPPLSIVHSIKASQNASFLFIAAGDVEKETEYNNLFFEERKDKSQLWIAERVSHTQAIYKYSDKYENSVIEFFNKNLLLN